MDKFSSRTGFDGWGKHFLVAKLSESLPGAHQFFTHWKKLYMKSKKIQQQQNTKNLQKSQKPPHKYLNQARASKASLSPLYYHVMCHKRPKGQFLHVHSIQGHSQSKSVKTYT